MRSIVSTGVLAFALVAAALVSQSAQAEGRDADGCCGAVVVLPDQTKAYGLLADARNSSEDPADPESSEVIGCTVSTSGRTSPVQKVVCSATSKRDISAMCESVDPGFVKVAQALSNFSWMYFEWDDAGDCTMLSVRIGSAYLPDIERP